MISHDEAYQRMHGFLRENIPADSVRERRDEIQVEIDGQQYVIVSPVKTKQRPKLEQKLARLTEQGIATGFVFPKSSSRYAGNYIRVARKSRYSQGGDRRWHNNVKLSTVEQFLLDTYGNIMVYFDVSKGFLEHVEFRKHPWWHIADLVSADMSIPMVPPDRDAGDFDLLESGLRLRAAFGRGYVLRLPEDQQARYRELKQMYDKRLQVREKLNPQVITKSTYTLQVRRRKGILLAQIGAN